MMKKFKHCIFDFDGTLADTSEGIVQCVKETLHRMGLPDRTADSIKHAIGLPLQESLKQGGAIPEDRIDEAVEIYRSIFFDVASQYILLFTGVPETLQRLRSEGISLSIATSRGINSLDKILDNYGLKDAFTVKATSNGNWKPKPAPDMVLYILECLKASPDETLVIGDTTYDIAMGAGAGCKTCGVSWGNHSPELLASVNPDHIIGNMEDLLKIVF